MQATYSPKMTLDRIDNDLGYSKENCQWLSREDNTRKMLKERKAKAVRSVLAQLAELEAM